jgi:hypothetical protein
MKRLLRGTLATASFVSWVHARNNASGSLIARSGTLQFVRDDHDFVAMPFKQIFDRLVGQAIPIAVPGLLANLASVWLLSSDHHDHSHDHAHGHGHEDEHEHDHHDAQAAANRDHNIRSAYNHVIGDAAVSVLPIIGLLLAHAFGWVWMDPLAGIIGALVITNWSWGLCAIRAAFCSTCIRTSAWPRMSAMS